MYCGWNSFCSTKEFVEEIGSFVTPSFDYMFSAGEPDFYLAVAQVKIIFTSCIHLCDSTDK